jgi:OTU domain-containing protein 6
MAANVLQRPICVYQPRFGAAPQHIITYGEDKAATPIHLLWSGAHYDLLLPQPSSRL